MGLLQFLVISAVDEVGNSLLCLTVLLDECSEHAEHLRPLAGIAADQAHRHAQRRQDVAQDLDFQVSRQRREDAGYEVRRHQVGVLGSVVEPAEHAVGVDLHPLGCIARWRVEDDAGDQRSLDTLVRLHDVLDYGLSAPPLSAAPLVHHAEQRGDQGVRFASHDVAAPGQ
ncbi:hypothetical protein PCP45_00150 [Pseudomonas aeruginosa]